MSAPLQSQSCHPSPCALHVPPMCATPPHRLMTSQMLAASKASRHSRCAHMLPSEKRAILTGEPPSAADADDAAIKAKAEVRVGGVTGARVKVQGEVGNRGSGACVGARHETAGAAAEVATKGGPCGASVEPDMRLTNGMQGSYSDEASAALSHLAWTPGSCSWRTQAARPQLPRPQA